MIDEYKFLPSMPDVVEVTRCRDCKSFALDEIDKEEYGCDVEAWCYRHCFSPEPDGFCAWAERRGDA